MREQLGELVCMVRRNPTKDVPEPFKRVYSVHFAGAEEGIQHGGSSCAFMASGKEVVLSSDGHWADGVFNEVVVDQQFFV